MFYKIDEEDEEVDEMEEAADSMADEIEAILKLEFPLEENEEDEEDEEDEENAIVRLEVEIEQRFVIDEEDLATVTVQ